MRLNLCSAFHDSVDTNFFIHMSSIWIHVNSHVLASRLFFVLCGGNFTAGHYMQTFQSNSYNAHL